VGLSATSSILHAIETRPTDAVIEIRSRGSVASLSRDELIARAGFAATRLTELGVGRGDRVAFVMPTSATLLAGILGTWMVGGVTTCLGAGVPSRGRERMVEILRTASPRIVVGVGDALAALRDHVPPPTELLVASELHGFSSSSSSYRPQGDDPAHLQFTSGTTGNPRGVVLRHEQLVANVVASGARARFHGDDRLVSWLPLFHDMGFVGGVMGPLYFGMPLCLLATECFLARPSSWLEAITEFRGTLSPGPTFAYDLLATRTSDERLRGIDLGTWRYGWIGAEPVFAHVLERFASRFAPCGLGSHVLRPAYGLAESTLAVTMPAPGVSTRVEWVDREVLRRDDVASPRPPDSASSVPIVGVGAAIDGARIQIASGQGDVLGDRRQGRILIAGPCVATSSLGDAWLQTDGWLDTGDLGFTHEGELFITGRTKDLLIRAGQKIHPTEIEQAAVQAFGVRGRAAAFCELDPVRGREQIIVVVESTNADDGRVEGAVRAAVASASGVQIDRVVITRPGTIPLTTSGKVQRSLLRDRMGGQ
jgi:acyl-CoA synthetase (AMP-forming)/AMP-acid ligase II